MAGLGAMVYYLERTKIIFFASTVKQIYHLQNLMNEVIDSALFMYYSDLKDYFNFDTQV